MSKHYVCAGDCGGVSDTAKLCDSENCTRKGVPLDECNCADDSHHGIAAVCRDCGKLCRIDGGTCEMEVRKEELPATA